jgi:glycosyltransferase involved in cell wall biosynthesis
MKIAVVVSTFPPYSGGMGNSAFELARFLAMQNEVKIFTLARDDCHCEWSEAERSNPDEIATSFLSVAPLKPTLSFGFKNGGFVPALYKQLRDFDAIYLHYPFFGGTEIVWLFKMFHPKVKLMIHFHMDTPALSGFGKILSLPSFLVRKSLFRRADKIIAASLDYVAHSSIKKYFKKWPEKFVEIPFGVHLEKFHVFPHDISELQELRRKYGIQDKDRVIMFLGALDAAHKFKGVEILLQAFADLTVETRRASSLRSENHNVKLLICGDGDLKNKYQKLAKELNIDNHVIFAGRVPEEELTLHYNLADIFVLPSVDASEAFGMVLLEAMACGVPVMASDLPGVRSVFANGVQGYTVAPGSARHLRGKIEEFLKYPQRRYKMGRAARELAEKKYSWEKVGERLQEIFR